MHSTISSELQRKAFDKFLDGWKIVLSTNLCESSVTIPDVIHVIDTGLIR